MGNWVAPGLGDVGAFQVSGIPFTHSAVGGFTVDFKFVTRAVTVLCESNHDSNTINFGPGTSNVRLIQGVNRFEVKCKQVVIGSGDGGKISIVAEMTGIPANHFTGSIDLNLYGTVS